MNEMEGRFATLKIPYLGDRRIRLIEKNEYKWLVEICGSGAAPVGRSKCTKTNLLSTKSVKP